MNLLALTGNLGNDPEGLFNDDGLHIVNFPLAFSFGKKKTGWIKVVCFNKTAEIAEKYLHKGARVIVTGSLQQDRWESNGEKKSTYKFTASSIEFIKTDGRGFEDGNDEMNE